jgi:hypothetical protein
MNDKSEEKPVEITPIEQSWQKALQNSPQPEEHLAAETIIELAQKGKRCLAYEMRMDHIVYCAICRKLLQEAQQAQSPKPARSLAPKWPWILAPTAALVTAAGMLFLVVKPAQQERDRLAGKLHQMALAPTPEPRIVVATPAPQATLAPTPRPAPAPTASPAVIVATPRPRPEPTPRTIIIRESPKPAPVDEDRKAMVALADTRLDFLPGGGGKMGGNDAPVTIRPLQAYQTSLDAQHPVLLWEDDPKATSYLFTLKEEESGDMVEEGKTASTAWRVAAYLKPGVVYVWHVQALGNDDKTTPISQSPSSSFQVLVSADREKALAARKRWGTAPLRLALELARLQLYEEALAEVERYRKSHPKDARVEAFAERLRKRETPG